MVGTYDGSKLKLYINGTLINNATDTGFSATPKPIYVGYISSLGTNVGMNGSVDEVRIYNRALSAAEIRQQYYSNLNKLSNNSWQFYINESCLVYGNYTYYGYANDAQGNYNQTDTRKLNIMPQAPTIVSSRIYTTPTAYTNDTLYGYCNATDVQNFAITYYYQWFLNNVFNRSGSVGAFSQGQEVNVANISSNNLTAGQNWTLSCMANNSYYNSSWLNSSTPTNIVSGIPTNVSLSYPVNANSSVHQRTPVFIWGNSTPNVLWYEINFTSNHCPNFNYSSISAPKTNYTPTSELCLANDNGGNSFYNWTVRACNNVGCSAWSTSFNFSLESWVVLTMVNNSVNFGTAILGQVLNTNSGNPAPFVVENDGNVAADLINISGNQSLWVASGAQLGTRYLQMKVRNSSLQGSFNYSGSITNWTNVTASNQSVVKQLDYNTSRNQAYIDIQIEVPGAEPPGTKQTNLILNFAQSP
jgi:hypothetical protein